MKNRFHAGVLAGILALPVAAFGQAPPAPTSEPAKPAKAEPTHETTRLRSSRNAAISTLGKRVDTVEWSEVNFEFVIDWLRQQGGGSMNVNPDWTPLGAVGVAPETFVTLSLRNTTVAEVLDATLKFVNDAGEVKYRAIGNTLRISTVQDFNRKMYVRVYDVTNLLMRVPDFDDAPEIDLTQLQAQGGGGGGGGKTTPPVFSTGGGGQGEEEETEEEIKERLEELRKLIEETVEPDFWDREGGSYGRIRVYNKMLVIRASIEVHEEIAGFFEFK